MAAPNTTQWGSIVGDRIKLGIYTSVSSDSTTSTVTYQVWLATKWRVSDSANTLYFDTDSTSATTSRGNVSVSTTVSSGSGWSESNHVLLYSTTQSFSRGSGDVTHYASAALSTIEVAGGTAYVTASYVIPAKPAPDTYYQTVYARYQQSDGSWSGYSAVISGSYTVGSTVSWSRGADAVYKAASISYTVSSANTKYVDVYRQTYVQTINVAYQNADGTLGDYSTVSSNSYYYGATYSGSWGGDVTYKSTTLSYTVTGTATKYVDVYRNEYPIHFDPNGGLFTPSDQYYIYGGTTQLSKYRPTRSGYKFLGWSLNANTTEATYSHQGNFTFDDSEPTLYAIWEKVNQSIYLYDDGRCYAGEFIEDTVVGFGKYGCIYSPAFDETKSADGVFEINETSFPSTSFIEGLPS